MKFIRIVLVALVLLVNVIIVQPALADRPNPQNNPDYIEITEELNTLLQDTTEQDPTVDQVQRIADLRFQKYVMETGKKSGICRNDTANTIAVYGQKGKKSQSTYDNELYLLPAGEETDDDWSCSGIYLPSEVTEDQEAIPATALKIVNGTYLVATTNPKTSKVELNVPPAKVYKAGEANWFIPDTLQDAINAGATEAPID